MYCIGWRCVQQYISNLLCYVINSGESVLADRVASSFQVYPLVPCNSVISKASAAIAFEVIRRSAMRCDALRRAVRAAAGVRAAPRRADEHSEGESRIEPIRATARRGAAEVTRQGARGAQ